MEEKLDEMMKNYDGCKCERCRADIIASALNNLPPKYVVTDEGELYAKIPLAHNRYDVEVVKQLAAAANLVKKSPHH